MNVFYFASVWEIVLKIGAGLLLLAIVIPILVAIIKGIWGLVGDFVKSILIFFFGAFMLAGIWFLIQFLSGIVFG